MKAGWRVVPLAEVAAVGAGNPAPQDKADFEGGSLPFIRTSDVGQIRFGEIATSADLVNERCAKRLRLVPAGTVLFPKSGASTFLNHRVITAVEAYVSSHLATITARSDRLDSRFLLYALSLVRAQDLLPENSYPSLNLSLLGSATIPLPTLDEQKRIVAVLDEAFEGLSRARANAEANLADARELFAAALTAEFSRSPDDWREVALSEIGKTITGSTPRTSDAGNLGGDLPFIKPGDFLPDGRLDYENESLSDKGAAVSRVLPPGCALMVCIGATIGKSGYSERKIATNQQINAVVPNAGISGEFIYLQMIMPEFQREVLRNAGQATLPIINKSKWSELKVRVPKNLVRQHEITDRMRSLRDVISDLEARYSAARSELDSLRQSLLQKAFSGELT